MLGAALIARGLAGDTSRNPATGRRKSPGLLGSIVLTLIGGLFFGVGVYVNRHAATLAAKPGSHGSPKVLAWAFMGIGGLVMIAGALTLLSRIGALIIGSYLLIAGRFEHGDTPSVPTVVPVTPNATIPPAPIGGDSTSAPLMPPPLVPPPLDPRLPRFGG